jgi:hypothetical protein
MAKLVDPSGVIVGRATVVGQNHMSRMSRRAYEARRESHCGGGS